MNKIDIENEYGQHLYLTLDELRNWINIKLELIKELQHTTEWQGNIIKKFADELRYFQKQQQNVLYKVKLKKYRDEIIQLKKQIQSFKNQSKGGE